GVVTIAAMVHSRGRIDRATLRAGGTDGRAEVLPVPDGWRLHGHLRVPDPPLWWPHTHGGQLLVPCSLIVETGGRAPSFDAGAVGFRTVEAEPGDGFGLRVNGEPVYGRGARWTGS